MSEKFIFYGLGRARNGEHFEYINHVLSIFTDSNAVTLNALSYRNNLVSLFNKEDEALKQILSYEDTQSINEYDAQRDELFNYINSEVKNQQRSPLAGKKAAANHLTPLMKTYSNTDTKAQRDETGLLDNLITTLQSETYAADVTALGLTEAVEAMKTANKAFNDAFYLRVDEKEYRRATSSMKTIRPQVDKAYQDVLTILNSLYNVYALNPHDFNTQFNLLNSLADALNANANDMKQALIIRSGKGNLKPGGGDDRPEIPENPGGDDRPEEI